MPEIADLIADVVARRRPPEAVRSRTRELAAQFNRIGFSFDAVDGPAAS